MRRRDLGAKFATRADSTNEIREKSPIGRPKLTVLSDANLQIFLRSRVVFLLARYRYARNSFSLNARGFDTAHARKRSRRECLLNSTGRVYRKRATCVESMSRFGSGIRILTNKRIGGKKPSHEVNVNSIV